jgi:hypothetical protein
VEVTNTTSDSKLNSATPPPVNDFNDESNKLAINLPTLGHLLKKRKRIKSKEDQRKIARLKTSKHETFNVKSERDVKQESADSQSSVILRSSFTPQVDRKPEPFPLTMDLDYKTHIKQEAPSGPSSTVFANVPAKATAFTLPPPALPALPLRDAKPTIQPIASGLKPSIPEPHGYGPMDVHSSAGSDSDGDFYGYRDMPAIANEVIDKIGIKVPPPIITDAHDFNGDYYGRGHDIFVGPKAQADECVPS